MLVQNRREATRRLKVKSVVVRLTKERARLLTAGTCPTIDELAVPARKCPDIIEVSTFGLTKFGTTRTRAI